MKTGIVNSTGQSHRVLPSDKDRSNSSYSSGTAKRLKKKKADEQAPDPLPQRKSKKALIDEYI
jgi:hypothetical protein